MDGFEVQHDFPALGQRTMLLNARQVIYEGTPGSTILLPFVDVTERRSAERKKGNLLTETEEWLRQKDAGDTAPRCHSLQIIASILLLKTRAVTSEETRHHLQDAHQPVMSVAETQWHLHPALNADEIEVDSYSSKLCASLASLMVAESQRISVKGMAKRVPSVPIGRQYLPHCHRTGEVASNSSGTKVLDHPGSPRNSNATCRSSFRRVPIDEPLFRTGLRRWKSC
jgi:chemotaxis protein methyltransferase CheR